MIQQRGQRAVVLFSRAGKAQDGEREVDAGCLESAGGGQGVGPVTQQLANDSAHSLLAAALGEHRCGQGARARAVCRRSRDGAVGVCAQLQEAPHGLQLTPAAQTEERRRQRLSGG